MEIKELEGDILKAVKESTLDVFSTMIIMDVKAEDSRIVHEKTISTDIISSLHYFGDKYMGKIALFSSGNVACQLTEAMIGVKVTQVNEEVKDCVGEIINMIAGGVKTRLESRMGVLSLLTPWVISGKNITVASPKEDDDSNLTIDSHANFSWIMTKFTLNNGHFSVGMQPNQVPQK